MTKLEVKCFEVPGKLRKKIEVPVSGEVLLQNDIMKILEVPR